MWQQSNKDMQHIVKLFLFNKIEEKYTCTSKYNEGLFPCTICGDKFGLESSLELHMKRSSVLITHFCQTCNKILKFFNKCSLLSHVFSHVTNELTLDLAYFKIEQMPLQFLRNKNIKINKPDVHLFDKSNIFNKELNDKLLSITKNNNISITTTYQTIDEEPKKLNQVENVSQSLSFSSSFSDSRVKCVKCYIPSCNKICLYENIESHILTAHTKIYQKCVQCDITFFLPIKIKHHMQSIHKSKDYSSTIFRCEMCKRDIDEADFTTHNEKHLSALTVEYFYYCSSCKSFLQHRDQYKNHISNCSSSEKSKVQVLSDNSHRSLLKPIYVKEIENKFIRSNPNIKKMKLSHTNSAPVIKQNDITTKKTMIKIKNSHILDKILFTNNNRKFKVTARKLPRIRSPEKLHSVILESKTSYNECHICNKKFDSDFDLKIHLRTHGMAFLKKSKNEHLNTTV